MTSKPVESISDTALWVALYRAMETERPDAHFRDPFARELAGPRGEEIAWLWRLLSKLSSKESREQFRRSGGAALIERT